MNKKQARKKKHQREKRTFDILDSEIIGDVEETDEINEETEEEETLLGNLARVKQIPVMAFYKMPPMTFDKSKIFFDPRGSGTSLKELLTEISENEDCDLLGLTPVTPVKDRKSPMQLIEELGIGSIGSAVQVREIEETPIGTLDVHVWGVCRYENIGLIKPHGKMGFDVKVRWFEDEPEPDEVIKPLLRDYLKVLDQLKKRGKQLYAAPPIETSADDHMALEGVSYLSFILLNEGFKDWFTFDERLALFRTTSTSERLTKILERAEKMLPLYSRNKNSEMN